MQTPPLYIWLGTDPLSQPPDTSIEDTPGVSDVDLLLTAIATGVLGDLIPAKLAISPHEQPSPRGFRSIDTGRLLRDHRIPHRQMFQLLAPKVSDDS